MENLLSNLNISESLIEAIGWTVLHSLWQGTIIALLVGVLAAFIQKQSAVIRYWTALGGMLATLIWAGITFVNIYLAVENQTAEVYTIIHMEGVEQVVVSPENKWSWFTNYFETQLPLIVTLWMLGMSVFALRFLGGLAYVRYLRASSQPVTNTDILSLFDRLKDKVSVHFDVLLGTSTKIFVPITMGLVKPIVLLPAGTLLALSPTQLEAVIAHELAHIRRRDYLVNIFQSLVEVIFYYHPAVWWLSAQVRQERENCCDDLAVAACGDDLAYAKALLSLQAYAKGAPAFAMAFSNKKDHLLNRVKRILNHPINRNRIMEKFSMATLVLICLLVLSMRGNNTEPKVASFEEGKHTLIESKDHREMVVEVIADNEQNFGPQTITVQVIDTIPQGKVNLKLTKDGERIEAKLNNGKIQELKVNGKVQPESNYDAYLPILEEVMNSTPPVPPVPPVAPPAMVPPTPPAPPGALSPPAAPAAPAALSPPTPPTAPAVISTGSSRVEVKTETDENGNTFVFVTTDEEDKPMEIKVTSGDMPKVIINGEEIDSDENLIFISENDEVFEFNTGQQKRLEAKVARVKEGQERMAESQMKMAVRQEQMTRQVAERQAAMEQRAVEMEKLHAERMQESQKRLEENQAKLEAQQEKREQLRVQREKANRAIVEEMLKDGLLESVDNYSIELNDQSLKINGKKQPNSVFKKYKKMFENISGFEGAYNISIQESKN